MEGSDANLQSGFPLFLQQFRALLLKNFLLSWRNKRATFLQLSSSLLFMFLIFCIQKSIDSRFSTTTNFKNVFDPEPLVSPSIPPCEVKFLIKTPCFDFAYSGNSSAKIRSIVAKIMANNPGRTIPDVKVKPFSTPAEVDVWLESNPMRCPGALHFVERNSTFISYGIQTNSTIVAKRGAFEDPTFKFQIPLQIAAEREIARSLIGDPNFSWVVGLKEFAHPAIETFSAVGTAGPTFFLAIAMFGFVFQVSSMVAEKELKLRQAMSIMGLYESAYWFSWLTWETLLTLVTSLFLVLFGMMFQFDFFLNNSFAVLFLLFFLFQFNMTGFAFMMSAFIDKSSSATTVGFAIFILGFLTQLVTTFGFPYTTDFSKTYRVIWSLFPPNLLAEALNLLGDATATSEDKGISWNNRGKCPDRNSDCVLTIDDIYKWLVSTFFLWFLLAIYYDNILPNSSGVRKSAFYFLRPSYWTGNGGDGVEEAGLCSCTSSTPPSSDFTPEDEDVLAEEEFVKQQATSNELDIDISVQIRGLIKTYPGTTKLGCCCKCQRSAAYHAVKGIWVNFAKDQLFCLLGPNGAGKTTVINCLTGITPVTSGDALIYGYSIRSAVGMSYIRRMIGVCPQFDILWDSLSGQEHMHLFASIKGLPPASIKSVADMSLSEVKLTDSAKMRAGSYSGGMKRRLSVAISLIGDPKLVFLDEPTTGMDPITRRHVWDIIEDAKKGRAIILTTHSMEEADILSDRIAIMAKGKLRCIGTSIRLKSRFGTGYIATVSFLEATPTQTPSNYFFASNVIQISFQSKTKTAEYANSNNRAKPTNAKAEHRTKTPFSFLSPSLSPDLDFNGLWFLGFRRWQFWDSHSENPILTNRRDLIEVRIVRQSELPHELPDPSLHPDISCIWVLLFLSLALAADAQDMIVLHLNLDAAGFETRHVDDENIRIWVLFDIGGGRSHGLGVSDVGACWRAQELLHVVGKTEHVGQIHYEIHRLLLLLKSKENF